LKKKKKKKKRAPYWIECLAAGCQLRDDLLKDLKKNRPILINTAQYYTLRLTDWLPLSLSVALQ